MHEVVKPFEFLVGTWQGQGHGFYPTIEDFSYSESVTFTAIPGKPFLRYEQKTLSPQGVPMHTELGFFRPQPGGHVEFVIAQPTGQTELLEGTATVHDDGSLTMVFGFSVVANTSSAKSVEQTIRHYVFNAQRTELHHEFEMAAVGEPLQQHLEAKLTKAV